MTLHTSSAPALVSVTLKKSCSRALVEAVEDGTAVAPQMAGAAVLLAAWSLTGVLASTESVDRRLPGLTTRFSGDRDLSRCTAKRTSQIKARLTTAQIWTRPHSVCCAASRYFSHGGCRFRCRSTKIAHNINTQQSMLIITNHHANSAWPSPVASYNHV